MVNTRLWIGIPGRCNEVLRHKTAETRCQLAI